MIVRINDVDITPYIAYGGVSWKREYLDGPNAGRGLDGTLQRDYIGKKTRLDITCRPLTSEEAALVLSLIDAEWVDVYYSDPCEGEIRKKMYSNNQPATFLMRKPDGTEYWSGITFPLIEQ